MAVYKCTNCKLLGSGIPPKDKCPNCGVPLIIKVAADDKSDDLYAGQYKTVFEIKNLIDSMLEKEGFKYFLISQDMYDFIKTYYSEETANLFQVNKYLPNFNAEIINYDKMNSELREKFEKRVRTRVILRRKRAERIRKLEDRITKKVLNYIYMTNKISELEESEKKEKDPDIKQQIKKEIAGMKKENINLNKNNGLNRDLAQLQRLKEIMDKENKQIKDEKPENQEKTEKK